MHQLKRFFADTKKSTGTIGCGLATNVSHLGDAAVPAIAGA
jgi:hypothetical protein